MADDKQENTPPPPPPAPTQTPAKSDRDDAEAKPRRAEKNEDSRPEARVVIHGPEDSPLNNGEFAGVDPVYQTEPDPAD